MIKKLFIIATLLLALLSLLDGTVAFAAPVEVGTRFHAVCSDQPTTCANMGADDILHAAGTVPSGTEALLCKATTRGNRNIVSAAWNTSETATEIVNHDSSTGGTTHVEFSWFIVLNPTATTADFTVTFDGNQSGDNFSVSCTMWDDLDDSSVANATNVDTPVFSEAADGATIVLPDFGSAGNTLIAGGVKIGANSDGGSMSNGSYTKVQDFDTGGGQNNSGDHGITIFTFEDITAASGGTITMLGGDDERGGVQIELVAEPAAAGTWWWD